MTMGLTTDRNSPCLQEHRPDGQQVCYLVLSEEERAKGFVMPVHRSYTHLACGAVTQMGLALCETYARNPKFYGGTFCCNCGGHFPLRSFVAERKELDAAKEAFHRTTSVSPPDDLAFSEGQARIRRSEAAYSNPFGGWQFLWPDGTPVGSSPEEAEAFLAEKARQDAEKNAGAAI